MILGRMKPTQAIVLITFGHGFVFIAKAAPMNGINHRAAHFVDVRGVEVESW
jgi:hypothetical protein